VVRFGVSDQVIISDEPDEAERDKVQPKRAADPLPPEPEPVKTGWNPFANKDKAKEKRAEMEAVKGEVLPPADDAPKRGRGRPPGSKNKVGRPAKSTTVRKQSLDAMFAMMGVMLTPFNAYDGAVILKNGGELSASLCKLADEDPRVAKMIDAMLTASTWSQVAMGFAAVGVPIMANHGMAPENLATIFKCPTPSEFKLQQSNGYQTRLEDLGIDE
jgi:hypothetical protein